MHGPVPTNFCAMKNSNIAAFSSRTLKISSSRCFTSPCSISLLLFLTVVTFLSFQILGYSFVTTSVLRPSKSTSEKVASLASWTLDGSYSSPMEYGIIIDAGSSGSRIHIYRYTHAHSSDSLPEIQWPVASMKQTPGLSNFASAPAAAGNTLIPLLEFAYEHVEADLQRLTPVVLMATAGMRLLQAHQAEAVLESCREVLLRSRFFFKPKWASVIPGYKEGVFGWAAANYAAGALKLKDPTKTVGVLELGGASSQVTFAPSASLFIPEDMKRNVTIAGTEYTLYTYSFLGLGQEAAQDTLASAIMYGSGKKVKDPCTPPAYESNIPTAVGLERTEPSEQGKTVSAVGNFTDCWAAAVRLVRQGEPHVLCATMRCGVGGMPTLQLHGQFLATENFFYTAEFFELGTKPTLMEVVHAGRKYCSTSWDEIYRRHGPESAPPGESTASTGRSQDDLLKYCFSAAYVVAFLHNGLGIDLADDKIHFSNSVGGVNVDWALGALIIEVAPKSLRHLQRSIADRPMLTDLILEHPKLYTLNTCALAHELYLVVLVLVVVFVIAVAYLRARFGHHGKQGRIKRYDAFGFLGGMDSDITEKGH